MAENQNIEWKESWRDEYLKWICGFANAQGGKIFIGTRDDGTVVGVVDSKKLLEDIPNKVCDILGIIVDVNLLTEDEKDYIEIVVNPSSYPFNFKGEYHYRSGSTKQLLRGAALTEFLLSKTGYKWDEIHGSLLMQADRVVELIYLKYMKAEISYDNVTRIETYPLPKSAVREAVYNAIIHSNYAALIPIQIRIHEDALYISNDCVFPVGWTVETLMQRHRSQPYNPNIANSMECQNRNTN